MKREWRSFSGKIDRLIDAAPIAERDGRDAE
jgi:hypothetical protein